jgi:hypothetical protein
VLVVSPHTHGHGQFIQSHGACVTVTVTVTDNLLKHKRAMFSSLCLWSTDVVPAYVTVAAMMMTFQTSRLCHGHGRVHDLCYGHGGHHSYRDIHTFEDVTTIIVVSSVITLVATHIHESTNTYMHTHMHAYTHTYIKTDR